VWVHDLTRDTSAKVTSGDYGFVIWTPDSKYLILATPSSGLMWMRADGSILPQVLIPSKTPMAPESITPDLKLAYHDNTDPRELQIWTVQLREEGGQLKPGKSELFPGVKGRSYLQAAFSRDGKWLAYTVLDTSAGGGRGGGRGSLQPPEVYVQPFPPSSEVPQEKISNNGGVSPVWSANGELFYASPDNRNIMVVTYSVQSGWSKPRVWLAGAFRGRGSANFDMHPDGKRLAILVPDTPEPAQTDAPKPDHTVVFLLNFFDELKRLAPIGK
jgi:hypothetical protein